MSTILAAKQRAFIENTNGPSYPSPEEFLQRPKDDIDRAFCTSQVRHLTPYPNHTHHSLPGNHQHKLHILLDPRSRPNLHPRRPTHHPLLHTRALPALGAAQVEVGQLCPLGMVRSRRPPLAKRNAGGARYRNLAAPLHSGAHDGLWGKTGSLRPLEP